jgi:hypothetical protein
VISAAKPTDRATELHLLFIKAAGARAGRRYQRSATMTTTAMQYAATLGLLGALVAATLMGLPAQVQAGTRGAGVMAQYCAPQHDSIDLHRIYCRDRG